MRPRAFLDEVRIQRLPPGERTVPQPLLTRVALDDVADRFTILEDLHVALNHLYLLAFLALLDQMRHVEKLFIRFVIAVTLFERGRSVLLLLGSLLSLESADPFGGTCRTVVGNAGGYDHPIVGTVIGDAVVARSHSTLGLGRFLEGGDLIEVTLCLGPDLPPRMQVGRFRRSFLDIVLRRQRSRRCLLDGVLGRPYHDLALLGVFERGPNVGLDLDSAEMTLDLLARRYRGVGLLGLVVFGHRAELPPVCRLRSHLDTLRGEVLLRDRECVHVRVLGPRSGDYSLPRDGWRLPPEIVCCRLRALLAVFDLGLGI